MSKTRITIEVLASGQPRPYADSQTHVRVTFEWWHSWAGNDADSRSKWTACKWPEADIRACLKTLKCGFTDAEPKCWADTRLNYLKEVQPGVWEFHTTTPFTD